MLRDEETITGPDGAGLTASSEWNPYNPVDFNGIERIITVDTPKLSEIKHWVNDRIMGFTGVPIQEYMTKETSLLKDRLNDVLVKEDEFRFLNWIYRIVRGKDPKNDSIIFQMPEDFYRVFFPEYYKHEDLDEIGNYLIKEQVKHREMSFMAAVDIEVCSIWDHFSSGQDAAKTYKVYSLKALALYLLLHLKAQQSSKLDGTPVSFTFTELCKCFGHNKYHYFDLVDGIYPYIGPMTAYLETEKWSEVSYTGSGDCVRYKPKAIGFEGFIKYFRILTLDGNDLEKLMDAKKELFGDTRN